MSQNKAVESSSSSRWNLFCQWCGRCIIGQEHRRLEVCPFEGVCGKPELLSGKTEHCLNCYRITQESMIYCINCGVKRVAAVEKILATRDAEIEELRRKNKELAQILQKEKQKSKKIKMENSSRDDEFDTETDHELSQMDDSIVSNTSESNNMLDDEIIHNDTGDNGVS